MTDKTYTLYLIRHGLTYQNLCREYQGSILNYDILPQSRDLIEGRQQRGSHLPSGPFGLPPGQGQADGRALFPGMEMEYINDLMEREFGDWDGRTHDELVEDATYQAFLEKFGQATPPGGESYQDFNDRMARVLDRIEALAKEAPRLFPWASSFTEAPFCI